MTNKEFEKWMKANPITFRDGINGTCGTMTVKGQTFTFCASSELPKRAQKSYIKEKIMEKTREILES